MALNRDLSSTAYSFEPKGDVASSSINSTSATLLTLPNAGDAKQAMVSNLEPVDIHVKFGASDVVATTSNTPVYARTQVVFTVPFSDADEERPSSHVSIISAGESESGLKVVVTVGTGL